MKWLHKIMCYFGYHEPWSHEDASDWMAGSKIYCVRCLEIKTPKE